MNYRKHRNNRTNLFFMEILSSILILSLCMTICIRLFSASWQNRKQAREWNHIQELIINVSELFKTCSDSASVFSEYLPNGMIDNDSMVYYYNSDWTISDSSDSFYQMCLIPSFDETEKKLEIAFYQNDTELYKTEIRYPIFSVLEKEAVHE